MFLQVTKQNESYDASNDRDLVREGDGSFDVTMANFFNAGQSRRIWNELYKVSIPNAVELS